jgi:hypothetical protein
LTIKGNYTFKDKYITAVRRKFRASCFTCVSAVGPIANKRKDENFEVTF